MGGEDIRHGRHGHGDGTPLCGRHALPGFGPLSLVFCYKFIFYFSTPRSGSSAPGVGRALARGWGEGRIFEVSRRRAHEPACVCYCLRSRRSRRYSGGSTHSRGMLGNQWEGKDKARGRRGVVRVGGGLPVAASRAVTDHGHRDPLPQYRKSPITLVASLDRCFFASCMSDLSPFLPSFRRPPASRSCAFM